MLAICGSAIAGALALPAVAGAAWPPTSMAALGDSLTIASGGGNLPYSWATGTLVNSHGQRLGVALDKRFNFAAGGKKANALDDQAVKAVEQNVDYVTIMIGTNDVCAEGGMTPAAEFRAEVATALQTLTGGLPNARIFVTSIPDFGRLWDTYKNDPNATAKWNAPNGKCTAFLRGPTAEARAHLIALNQALRDVCVAKAPRCVYDGNALYAWNFTLGDFSGQDYFHFSSLGQDHVAGLTYPIAAGGVTPPPAPPPTVTPPPPPAVAPPPPPPNPAGPSAAVTTAPLPAKLAIKRASIGGGKLDVLLSITGAATGPIYTEYLSGGTRTVFKSEPGPARQGEKFVKVLRRLVGTQRGERTGILTVTYRGNGVVQSDTLRSRAANGRSSLRRTALSFTGAHLVTQGTLKRGIGGVVRLRVTYTQPDGTLVAWIQNLRVANSRWSTDQQLAPEAAADPNAYLTVQFTGNATAAGGPYRGEQLGKGLANLTG